MTDSMNENEFRKYLIAFADGELDVEQNLMVLEYIAMHPQATRRIMHQQQLRQAIKRSIVESTPEVSDSLRQTINDLARNTPAGQITDKIANEALSKTAPEAPSKSAGAYVTGAPPTNRWAWVGRWTPAAAALVLFVSSLFVLQMRPVPTELRREFAMPVAQIDQFANRHSDCSRDRKRLVDIESYSSDLKKVPAELAKVLGTQNLPGLDLKEATGFDFKGMGNCSLPGKGAVHLVYSRPRPSTDANAGTEEGLSLWMAPYIGSPVIDPGYLYTAKRNQSDENPILVWRQKQVIYYLVGESNKSTEEAASILRESG